MKPTDTYDKSISNTSEQTHPDNRNSAIFSDRISDVPRSFIREILKVAISPDVISFAGGLPNRELFPVEELKQSAIRVFDREGRDALQYSNSEGYLPLREYIAQRYFEKKGLKISSENILITSGSQQGLDLLGKVLLNKGDEVIMEEPGYLGAIQAFSLYRPVFLPVTMNNEGIKAEELSDKFAKHSPKLMYTVPEFQNPSGISYTDLCRYEVAEIIRGKETILIEDHPYSDLRFTGTPAISFYSLLPEQTVLLGTFSKTIVPGFRLGWIVAPDAIMDKLIIAKQASDLHSNIFIQRLLHDFLVHNNIDDHIHTICTVYGRQKDAMISSILRYFPKETGYTNPEGGMFLWVELPAGYSSMTLFHIALEKKVAFVPGNPFYTDNKDFYSTLRLNFSCSNEILIEEGMRRLGDSIKQLSST